MGTPALTLLLCDLDRRRQRRGRQPGGELGPVSGAPAVAVLADPVQQGALKTDVVAKTFRLNPLVLQDLLPLGEEFLVQAGLFDEIAVAGVLWRNGRERHELLYNLC